MTENRGKIEDGLPALLASIERAYVNDSYWCLKQSSLEYLAEICFKPLPKRCYKAGEYVLIFICFNIEYPDYLMFDIFESDDYFRYEEKRR